MTRWLGVLASSMAAGAALWGCATTPPPPGPPAAPVAAPARPAPGAAAAPTPAPAPQGATAPAHYRCDQGIEFTVRFANDSAYIDSSKGGSQVALRDAGGVTPQQSVYSSARLRAEFGLGPAGREAKLRYLPDMQVASCVQE